MSKWFPTFARLAGNRLTFSIFWPWRTTWAQRRSLLRLIVIATEENVPLSRLIEVWAADESGTQKYRLLRLAGLWQAGTPLADAVEEVRGVLSDEDILAIRFGVQSGTLSESIRDMLDRPDPSAFGGTPRWRNFRVYVCVLLAVAFWLAAFSQIKIVPMLNQIFHEFELEGPRPLQWNIRFAEIATNYWYLFALAIIGVWWLVFSSWPGRQFRQGLLSRLFRPLRDLRVADVLQKLSVAAGAGRPIPGAISTLARYHFDPKLRHQLLFIRNEMEQGADAWQSMARLGLLSGAEAHLMATADRVGNRPWVLRQLAQLKKRRTMRRFAHWSELALPAIILMIGAFVLFQALGVFNCLADLIEALAF
jgi:type II secretory pathway component PulF